MRHLLIYIAAVAAVAASCAKNELSGIEPEKTMSLTVSIDNPITRAGISASEEETAIRQGRVFLLVFKSDGSREAGEIITLNEEKKASVNLSAGEKTVWVVANCPQSVLEAGDLSAFKSKISYLSENSDGLVMAGSASKVISGNDNVSVTLKRLAAKVALVNLSRNYSDPDYASAELVINRVYLSNASGACHYYSDAKVSSAIAPADIPVWYNKLGVVDTGGTALDGLLCVSLGISLTNNTAFPSGAQKEPVIYAYPNSCMTNNIGGMWNMATTQRYSRLVVECSLAGTKGYYNVSVPGIESNKVYNVSLTLKKKPASDPEDNTGEIDPALSLAATVSVCDWDTPILITETI